MSVPALEGHICSSKNLRLLIGRKSCNEVSLQSSPALLLCQHISPVKLHR